MRFKVLTRFMSDEVHGTADNLSSGPCTLQGVTYHFKQPVLPWYLQQSSAFHAFLSGEGVFVLCFAQALQSCRPFPLVMLKKREAILRKLPISFSPL